MQLFTSQSKTKKPQILLQDLGSKYGTYVNEGIHSAKEIAKNTPTRLKSGDKIRFGQQWNTWTVEESEFVVCTSTTLTPQDKASLRSLLTPMKGVLVSDWTENCTHLTMNNIKITIKVVCALGNVKPIVSMDYWRTLADVMKSTDEESIPDCDDFVPPLAEPSLMNVPTNFKMNNARKRLFRGIKFVACTTSQYNDVLPMVTNAGGTVIDGTRDIITEEQYQNEKILVLASTTVNRRNRKLTQLLKCLEKNQHRCIAESEIGLSLIFCSMDKHCNPTYDADFILRQAESQIIIKDEESILDLETQDLGDENSTQFFDDDSSKFSLAVNEKRIFSDSDDEQVIGETLQPRTQPVIEKPSAKRKLEDGTDKPNLKNSKLDSWIIREKPATRSNTSSVELPSQSVLGAKKTKSLFAFPRDRKPAEKSSDSLFKRSSTSSGSDMSESSVTENKRKRSSIELFSSFESTPVPLKKPHTEKKDLFQLPSTSKQSTSKTSLILFDSNDSMDSFSDKTAKLNITNKPEPTVLENTSVVVPRNISLSQFIDAPRNKSNGVKEEPADISSEVKEVFEKTVVHTLPLIKSNKLSNESCSNGGSVVNFKKFRKNNGLNRTCVISTNDLFLFKSKAAPVSDVQMTADSDSS